MGGQLRFLNDMKRNFPIVQPERSIDEEVVNEFFDRLQKEIEDVPVCNI